MARTFFRILERVRYIVLGAGKQGTAIVHDLVHADTAEIPSPSQTGTGRLWKA